MAHKLRAITIAGYKSIRHAQVELRDINILVGANGAGKSNLVGAFGLLHDIVQERLAVHVARRGGANSLLHLGRKVTGQMSFKLDFHPNGYEAVLAPTASDGVYFLREMCWFHRESHPTAHEKELGAGHTESKLRAEAGIAQSVIESIESWRVFHFHDTSESAPVKQKHEINDNVTLRSDAANLAAFLYRLRESGVNPSTPVAAATAPFYLASYRQIVGAVRSVAPFFDDFILQPDRLNQNVIQLAWRQKGSDEYFSAHALSDGTLRFICLATLLLQPSSDLPKAILIDEPELGLHPFAIHQLAAMIKSAAMHTQVIISTQSVTLMNQFQPEHVIVVDRDGGESTFRRISPEEIAQWVDDYALGELWEKNIIGGRPR
ncbi:MAG TPA: AAA family ATPase [Kofleriaceae bacterium]|nr:AAA family ATPase [Kofleriaceae bacterium]